MAGSNLGDDHKTLFAGDKALKADGDKNTSNQFKLTPNNPVITKIMSVVV